MRTLATLVLVALIAGCLHARTPSEMRLLGEETLAGCRQGQPVSPDLCVSLELCEALYAQCLEEQPGSPESCDANWVIDHPVYLARPRPAFSIGP